MEEKKRKKCCDDCKKGQPGKNNACKAKIMLEQIEKNKEISKTTSL